MPRGFAAMSPEKQREISSKGGKTAHAKGVAHQWDSGSAAAAGAKGGKATAGKKRAEAQSAAAMGLDD